MTFTLADLKTQRERIQAQRAEAQARQAEAQVVQRRAVLLAGLRVRDAALQALDTLLETWLLDITGQADETAVHHAMSAAAHEVLTQLGAQLPQASAALPLLGESFAKGATPRRLLTVSQWAAEHRWLRSGTNSPGPWRNELTPYLVEIQDALSEHSSARTVTFIKSSGVGGPLALDTPIPTPGGWQTMGMLAVGDTVFSELGQPCRVVSVSEVFTDRPCYRITFTDGASIVCDGEHRWPVIDARPGHLGKRRGQHRSATVLHTHELAASFERGERHRFSSVVAEPLHLPDADLPIPPYTLGYWLADGNLSGNQCTEDERDAAEVAAHLCAAGSPARVRKLAGDKGRACTIHLLPAPRLAGVCHRGHVHAVTGTFVNRAGALVCRECNRQNAMWHKYRKPRDPILAPAGFLTRVAALGLRSAKRIPSSYLRASIEQRTELLQGLMDGDGSITRHAGRCEFSTASHELAQDVLELLRSLGFKPTLGSAPRRGYSGQPATAPGRHWRISFLAYADRPVFKLARKRALQRSSASGNPSITKRRGIVSVEPVDSVPVRCIGVDSPSHLYLCGREMVPTHNTEAMYNWLGYVMHHLGNRDLLVVVPTLELRERSFNPRFAKMLDESPVLARLVPTGRRDKANRSDLMEYGARTRVIKAGANSPDSLRSDHLPYVICDEVDAFPWDVGGEGDPMTLIENRQRTYTRAKSYFVSTPTRQDGSHIERLYLRSDQRRYHVPCPHCGELQILDFTAYTKPSAGHGLKWRLAPPVEGEAQQAPQVVAAWYTCAHCGADIEEKHKPDMLAAGRWVAKHPQRRLHRGYHLNALYAPTGLGLGWVNVAQKWLDVQGDTTELKAFVNTYLGLTWVEAGDSIEPASLLSRLEAYPDTLPTILATAGIDVQKDRLEATVVDWDPAEQAWVRDHHILPGDTTQPQVWHDLGELLKDNHVQIACIDAGFNTTNVLAFCESRPWCIPTKGIPGAHRPLVEDEKKRKQRLRTRRKRGQPIEPLGVDFGKALLYSRLKLTKPGPGYIHFPDGPAFDDEYFAQLAAEKLVTKVRGTRPFAEWVQTRPRNEALDCMVLNLAAFRLAGLLRGKVSLGSAAAQGPEPTAAPPAAGAPPRLAQAHPSTTQPGRLGLGGGIKLRGRS